MGSAVELVPKVGTSTEAVARAVWPSCRGTREWSLAYQASDGSIKRSGQPSPDRA
jgi:hypothetical protein